MAQAKWTFVLTNIQGTVLGEMVNASGRQVIIPLKATPTAQFTVQSDNILAPYLVDPQYDLLLKCYRNNVLQFCGPVVSGQEQGSDQGSTIQVNAAGPFWRFNYRLLGIPTASGGTITPWVYGDQITTYDMGGIAWAMVVEANNQGYTGIDVDYYVASGSNGSAGPYQLQPIGDAIMSMASGVNSFEFWVTPMEPTYTGQAFPKIGSMGIAPLAGTVQAEVIFEYGAGSRNVISYSNTVDRQGLLNRGYMLQPAVSDLSDTLQYDDTAAQAARGVYAGAVDSGSVEWDVYRQNLLQTNVYVRRQGRQILNFVPAPNGIWEPFTNYNVGDQVRCRVTHNGSLRFDAMFRIWGIQFDIADTGAETPTLQLVPPTPSS